MSSRERYSGDGSGSDEGAIYLLFMGIVVAGLFIAAFLQFCEGDLFTGFACIAGGIFLGRHLYGDICTLRKSRVKNPNSP